jgi:FtsZ-binding cell division protein ZapB
LPTRGIAGDAGSLTTSAFNFKAEVLSVDSHLNQIQALIDEIEGVLQQPAPRLPWMGETTRESRALLDRVRGYLLEQQQALANQPHRPSTPQPSEPATESAEQLLQSVMQEVKGLRSSVVQPLREDIEALQRQRDELLQEIRHLDTQRQTKASLAQQSAQQQQIIAEFLQSLMGRLHDSISQQIGQTLNQIENEFFNDDASTQYQTAVLEGSETAGAAEYIPVWDPSAAQYGQRLTNPLHPRERLAQLRMFQHKIDEMILTLDSTVSVVFETLLQNVQVYEASLSKRLETMHNFSRQSEEMFAGLVNQFAQTLERQASVSLSGAPEATESAASLSASAAPVEREPQSQETQEKHPEPPISASVAPPKTQFAQTQSQPAADSPPLEEDWLQLLDTEESSLLSGPTSVPSQPVSEAGMEQQINQVYDDLFTAEETPPPASVPEPAQGDWFEESFIEEKWSEEAPESAMPVSGFPSCEEFFVEFQPFDEDTASLILDEPTNPSPQSPTSQTSAPPAPTDEFFPEFEPLDEDTASLLLDQPQLLEPSEPSAADVEIPQPPRPASRPKTSPPETRTAELSLKDLFSETAFPVETPPSSPTPSPASVSSPPDTYDPITDENWVVEGFIPASPDEDLLPVSEFEEPEPEPSFAINPITLNQLKQDLFSLEEGEEETSVQRWDEDLFDPATSPMSVTPELLPHQNWDNNSLEEWATELDRALSQSQSENAAYHTPISEEEEELLASVDDWFSQLSDEPPELTSDAGSTPPAMPMGDPSSLTLDEAFASLGASAIPPMTDAAVDSKPEHSDASEELDLFETADWNQPAQPLPVSAETPKSSSALDDLFAGLSASQDPEFDQTNDELFEFSDWQTPEDIDAETNEFETSKLDDLFATLIDEPPAPVGETEPDFFSTMDTPEFIDDDFLPEQSLRGGEKKNEEVLALDWEQAADNPFDLSASLIPTSSQSALLLEDWESKKEWYLSIDLGTTGLSATLFHAKTHELYPIYWRDPQTQQPNERCFRLPCAVILTASSSQVEPFDVHNTQLSLTLHPDRLELSANQVLFAQFKPYLKVGITGTQNGRTSASTVWEPVVQWSEHHQISLSLIQQALVLLLSTLNPAQNHTTLECHAVDLEAATFKTACEQLAGVMLSVPAEWPDSYSFNLREAVIGAGLVKHPEQIMVVSEAIAAVLSGLRGAAGEKIIKPRTFSEKLNFNSGADWLGGTVVITSGANVTEVALVNLPSNLQSLTYSDFYLQTLAYAGNSIDQDIICQLLLHTEKDSRKLEALDPSLIKLSAFETLPEPGEPMLDKRYRMQQLLESSAAGQLLLAAANQLKLILQHQEEFTLKLGKQRWVCVRKELEQRVFVPYVQHLNRELNLLLAESGMQPVAIKQVICTGGTASLPAISRWLRQKFSNATIIQDTYPPDRLPACSRIAYGLATVPLHPQVFDLQRQQYNDYFLLRELLNVFPNHPCTFAEVLQLLERQGINTRSCQSRLLTFLENRLPAGIHLDPSDRILLSEGSAQDPEYLTLQATPLFYSQENQTYRPNPPQFQRVRRHLHQLMDRTYQQIEEPFTINLG